MLMTVKTMMMMRITTTAMLINSIAVIIIMAKRLCTAVSMHANCESARAAACMQHAGSDSRHADAARTSWQGLWQLRRLCGHGAARCVLSARRSGRLELTTGYAGHPVRGYFKERNSHCS